jgi:hypothetical protein
MKNKVLLLLAFVLLTSHDMFLKLDDYFLSPNTPAAIILFNGTFERSENAISRDRMLDVSLLGNGQRFAMAPGQWSEKDSATILNFTTGEAGTWVAGVSTAARTIEMSAEDFNGYLEHDGVLDMLEWRGENSQLETDAIEKYSKHVKTIFQVGEAKTDDWQTELGYPIEFIPLENPYDLHPGHTLSVRLLWQGTPLVNQLVYLGFQPFGAADEKGHSHSEDADHSHGDGADAATDHSHAGIKTLTTDADGVVSFNITAKGVWYLRTIYMTLSDAPGLTHESNWATLTFGIGEGHSHEKDSSEVASDQDSQEGTPDLNEEKDYSLVYGVLLGIALVLLVFLWLRRRKGS